MDTFQLSSPYPDVVVKGCYYNCTFFFFLFWTEVRNECKHGHSCSAVKKVHRKTVRTVQLQQTIILRQSVPNHHSYFLWTEICLQRTEQRGKKLGWRFQQIDILITLSGAGVHLTGQCLKTVPLQLAVDVFQTFLSAYSFLKISLSPAPLLPFILLVRLQNNKHKCLTNFQQSCGHAPNKTVTVIFSIFHTTLKLLIKIKYKCEQVLNLREKRAYTWTLQKLLTVQKINIGTQNTES